MINNTINVQSNIKEFTRDLSRMAKEQIPYATSRAMNDTMVQAQEAEVSNVQAVFNNKVKWWNKANRRTGIRVEFSNKKNLTAAVYTGAYFATMQEDGGIKRPHQGKRLAVPAQGIPKKYRNTPGASGAAKALKEPRTFIFNGGYGKRDFTPGIWQRKGKKRLPIRLLFHWETAANIKPRFRFIATARDTVDKRFMRNFSQRLDQAIATAR